MAEESARATDGGLSNASRSCAGFRRDPTKDAALYELGGEECGGVPSRRDGRPVVLYELVGPRVASRVAQQEKIARGRVRRLTGA